MNNIKIFRVDGSSLSLNEMPWIPSLQHGEVVHDLEFMINRADGSLSHLSSSSAPVFDPGSNIIGAVVTFEDITIRKNEQKKIEMERILLKAIIDSLPVGVSVVDSNGHMILRNQPMYSYLGPDASSTDISDLSLFSVFRPGSDMPLKAEEMPVARAFLNGETVSEEELEIQRADGRRVVVLAHATPMRDEKDNIIGGLAVFTDVSKLKVLERELKRSNAELQQFAYIASHDLREPLRMVSSYLELIERRYKGKALDSKAEEYMHYAIDGADRMRRMIDDLLTYSRVDTKGNEFSKVRMEDVLDTALKDLRKRIEGSSASITHDSLPEITADGTQMIVLMENLIGNAIKFRGERPPEVHVSANATVDGWTFSVEDNGIGIAPEQRDRVFVMFQRLKRSRELRGNRYRTCDSEKDRREAWRPYMVPFRCR